MEIEEMMAVLRARKEPFDASKLRELMLAANLDESVVDGIIGGFHARSPEELRQYLAHWVDWALQSMQASEAVRRVAYGEAVATFNPETKQFTIKPRGTVN